MDASLFHGKEGVRSLGEHKLADGNKHELFCVARTPEQLVAFLGAVSGLAAQDDTDKKFVTIEKLRAKFLHDAMCDLAGVKLFENLEQAMKIAPTLKAQLCNLIAEISTRLVDDLKND